MVWKMWDFSTVDLAFHGQWHALGVRHQAPCSGKFTWLGNHPSLANRTGASVEVAKARCHYCFSKPGLLFSPFQTRDLCSKGSCSSKLCCNLAHLAPDLYSKCSCPRTIYNFGTASYQMPSSVLNGDCAVQKSEAAKL